MNSRNSRQKGFPGLQINLPSGLDYRVHQMRIRRLLRDPQIRKLKVCDLPEGEIAIKRCALPLLLEHCFAVALIIVTNGETVLSEFSIEGLPLGSVLIVGFEGGFREWGFVPIHLQDQ